MIVGNLICGVGGNGVGETCVVDDCVAGDGGTGGDVTVGVGFDNILFVDVVAIVDGDTL